MILAPTPQQLSTALALIDRSRWPAIHTPIVEYIRAVTIDNPPVGRAGSVKISSRTLALRTGLDHRRVFAGLSRLLRDQVLVRFAKGDGSDPSEWAISGDFERWDVPWRRERQVVVQHLALLCVAPWDATQLEVCVAPIGATQTPEVGASPRQAASVTGDFVSRSRARRGGGLFVALQGATRDDAPLLSIEEVLRTSSFEVQEEEEGPNVAAVLAAIHEISGRDLFGAPRQQLAAALRGLDDAGPVVEGLRAGGRQSWQSALAAAIRLARTGPAVAPVPRDAELARLESKVASLRRAAVHDPSWNDELAACENELHERRQHQGPAQ